MSNKRMTRTIALLLTVAGILAILPSQALAAWVIRRSSDNASANVHFTGSQGDITVNYK